MRKKTSVHVTLFGSRWIYACLWSLWCISIIDSKFLRVDKTYFESLSMWSYR